MRVRIFAVLAAVAIVVALLATGAFAGSSGTVKHPPKQHAAKQHHAKQHPAKQPKSTSKLEKRALFAVMTGRKEVDAQGNRRVGDPDGRGSFTAIVDGTQLCFGMTVTNVDQPIAAHIHKGRPNVAGPIVVPLTQPATGDPGASSGCVTVDPTLAAAILKNPHKYYVNVHTAAFPGGAARGQLFAKSR
jgi:CHRD domain